MSQLFLPDQIHQWSTGAWTRTPRRTVSTSLIWFAFSHSQSGVISQLDSFSNYGIILLWVFCYLVGKILIILFCTLHIIQIWLSSTLDLSGISKALHISIKIKVPNPNPRRVYSACSTSTDLTPPNSTTLPWRLTKHDRKNVGLLHILNWTGPSSLLNWTILVKYFWSELGSGASKSCNMHHAACCIQSSHERCRIPIESRLLSLPQYD